MTQLQETSIKTEKLRLWKEGNGVKGAEKRLQALEEKCTEAECPVGKQFYAHLKEHEKAKETTVDVTRWEKQMKQMRIQNFLGFLAMFVMIMVAMIWGG